MFTLMCTLGLCTLGLCTLGLWGDDVPVSKISLHRVLYHSTRVVHVTLLSEVSSKGRIIWARFLGRFNDVE